MHRHLALADRQVDAAQHVVRAVVLVKALDLDQRFLSGDRHFASSPGKSIFRAGSASALGAPAAAALGGRGVDRGRNPVVHALAVVRLNEVLAHHQHAGD